MITAIILAAGMSKRMGKPKMTLPWGETTVIETVVQSIEQAGLSDLCVVCGDNMDDVKQALYQHKIRYLYNKDYAEGEMLSSVKTALDFLEQRDSDAALIVLGDQPQIEVQVVKAILEASLSSRSKIVVPSYQFHRGHPWLVVRSLWKVILDMKFPDTLRNFLSKHQNLITYINVGTSSVIADLDTPDDYERYQP